MKCKRLMCITAITVIAAAVPIQMAGQNRTEEAFAGESSSARPAPAMQIQPETTTASATSSLNGTLSVTDSATDSPQTVAFGLCSRVGQVCIARRCCPGLICEGEGNTGLPRFCRPPQKFTPGPETKDTLSGNTCTTSSFWDRVNANKLQ